MSEHVVCIMGRNEDNHFTVDLRDIENIKRGSCLRKLLVTELDSNFECNIFYVNLQIFVYDGFLTLNIFDLSRSDFPLLFTVLFEILYQ